MVELYRRSDPIDLYILRSSLSDSGGLDEIGGVSFLLDLQDYSSSAPNIEKYIRIVRDKSILRRLISSALEMQSNAYRQSSPASDILENAEKMLYRLSIGRTTSEPEHVSDVLARVLEEQVGTDGSDGDAGRRVIATNYYALDEKTTGFHPGELIIVAGRPSMGKTSLLLSMAVNIAGGKDKVPVAFFSLEMSREQCTQNMLCGTAKVPVQILRKRRGISRTYRDTLFEAADRLSDIPIILDDSAMLSPTQLRSRARRLKSSHNIGVVFIDYLQLMQGDRRIENRQQEVAEISRNLKLLSKELKVPIIAGSQISRGAELGKDARPRLSHLRESGAIEQDADVVLMLYRDDYYNENSKEPGITEVIIGKQRNGPTGTIKLQFLSEYTRFENRAIGEAPFE